MKHFLYILILCDIFYYNFLENVIHNFYLHILTMYKI